MATPGAPRTQALGTAVKCLRALEEISRAEKSVRVSELARRMGINRAAAHQQLVTLVSAGWLEQLDDGSYRLTLRSAQIGQAALRQAGLGERVLPVLERLVSEVREAVSIAVLERGTATIVQRLEPDRPLQVDIRAEARMPINRSASGLVLIAYASQRELDDLRAGGVELPGEDELELVRQQGYAISSGRWLEGVTAIAAPFFSSGRTVAGALSVTGPVSRYDPMTAREALIKGAHDLTELLSGSSPEGGRR